MKRASIVVAGLLALLGSPLLAGDGQVPSATLQAIGLRGMRTLSDADGMQVRGQAVTVQGTSLLFAQLVDPATNSAQVGSSVNSVFGTNSGVTFSHAVTLNFSLTVVTGTTFFFGQVSGSAGGSGTVTIIP